MLRRILLIIVMCVFLGLNPLFVNAEGITTLRITTPPDPNMIPTFILMEKSGLEKKGIKLEYIPSFGSPDMMAHLLKGDIDLAGYSISGGSRLYAKGFKDIRFIGCHVWNAIYLVAEEDISNFEDLKRERILIAFRGGPPDLIARGSMKAAGYSPKDFRIEYLPGAETKALLIAGKAKAAVFPEPHISLLVLKSKAAVKKGERKKELKVAIDLNKGFVKAIPDLEGNLPLGGLWAVVSDIKEKKEAVEEFIKAFDKANDYAMTHPKEAGKIVSKYFLKYYGGKFPAKAVEMAISSGRLLLDFREQTEVRSLLVPYLKALEFPVPDEGIYYKRRELIEK